MIEGSLEAKPSDKMDSRKAEVRKVRSEKIRDEKVRREKIRDETVRREEMQVREKVGESPKTMCFSNVLWLRRVEKEAR